MDAPLIDVSRDGLDSDFLCNPAVTPTPDGRFLMVYKCGDGTGLKDKVYHTTAEAKTPLGPFVKSKVRVFDHKTSRFPAEDPFIWYQDGKPSVLFLAAKKNDMSYNVHIPLEQK